MSRIDAPRLAALGAACLWVGSAIAGPTLYHVVPLAIGPSGNEDAINRHGVIAGASNALPAVLDQGVVTTIGTVDGYAAAINDSGVVAGTLYTSDLPEGTHPFVFKKDKVIDIGPWDDDGDPAYGVTVNNDNVVLCMQSHGSAGGVTYLYEKGKKRLVGPPPGLSAPEGAGMNNLGDVVGVAWDSSQNQHAFLYHDGVSTALDLVDWQSRAYAINDNGQVVGTYVATQGAPMSGFIWTAGTMTDLGFVPNSTYTQPIGVNKSGEVVGTSLLTDNLSVAFVYKKGRIFALNSRLDAASKGWNIIEAVAVTDTGAIVGMGSTDGIHVVGILATPVTNP